MGPTGSHDVEPSEPPPISAEKCSWRQPYFIHAIVVHGLIKDNSGVDVPLRIEEGDCQLIPLAHELLSDLSDPRAKRLSNYMERAQKYHTNNTVATSAGGVEVHIKIVSRLDNSEPSGGDPPRHFIYCVQVLVDSISSDSSEQPDSRFMIMKIASEREGRSIAREAVMYKHLLCLQGTVIPQCYGYFRRFIDLQAYVVKAWDPDCEFPRTESSFDIFQWPNARASLNVLLLEDVGDCIPPARLNKEERESVKATLHKLHDELAYFGVYHKDLRYDNVLQTTIRRGVSPKHKEVYPYRIIDFEAASIIGVREDHLVDLAKGRIMNIMHDIEARLKWGPATWIPEAST